MKGILFKPDMLKAIMEGRKTVTRRVIKPQPPKGFHIRMGVNIAVVEEDKFDLPCQQDYLKLRYKSGETVYVKEAWKIIDDEVWYRIECDNDVKPLVKWHSPLFMPERYARTFLKIVSVRAERLQEITEADALKEGCLNFDFTALVTYRMLWDSINKPPYDWNSNPYVFRYEFQQFPKERIGK